MNQDEQRAALRRAHFALLHLMVRDFRAGYGNPESPARRALLEDLTRVGYAYPHGPLYYATVTGEYALGGYRGGVREDYSARVQELENKRIDLQKQIYQVVAKLGCKDNTQDVQHQLEIDLLTLEKANTNTVADWVHYKQLNDLLGCG